MLAHLVHLSSKGCDCDYEAQAVEGRRERAINATTMTTLVRMLITTYTDIDSVGDGVLLHMLRMLRNIRYVSTYACPFCELVLHPIPSTVACWLRFLACSCVRLLCCGRA